MSAFVGVSLLNAICEVAHPPHDDHDIPVGNVVQTRECAEEEVHTEEEAVSCNGERRNERKAAEVAHHPQFRVVKRYSLATEPMVFTCLDGVGTSSQGRGFDKLGLTDPVGIVQPPLLLLKVFC